MINKEESSWFIYYLLWASVYSTFWYICNWSSSFM